MTIPFRPLAMMTAVVLLASTSSWVTICCVRWNEQRSAHKDAHDRVHDELQITQEQDKQLEPLEGRYEEDKRHLAEKIRLASLELATALKEDKSESPRVLAAVQLIHEAQGELQKVTLRHVFEMKAVLTSAQYDRLIQLTAEALAPEPSGH
jgi:Spy/CpxP family protein refolding chaperone